MERQCWDKNQHSRRECLGISGIRENIENKDLENLTWQIIEKIGISVDPGNVEHYRWVKTAFKKSDNQVIQTKDTNKIRAEKKKWKGKNLTSLGINTPVYINDNLCIYYKNYGPSVKIYAVTN